MRYQDALKNKSTVELALLQNKRIHPRSCSSLQSKPAYGNNGFVYDVAIVQQCDCFLSQPIPETHEDRVTILRKLSNEFPIHGDICASGFHEPVMYRGAFTMMRLACNCWLSVDINAPIS